MTENEGSARRKGATVLRYGLAILSVAVVLILTFLLRPDVLIAPIFFLAILLSAWVGGIGPGMLSALLATLALAYFFLPPFYSLRFDPIHLPQLIVFFVSAVLVSSWSAARKRAERLLRQARDEQESKVLERTADLKQANEKLQAEIIERRRVEETLRERANLLDLTHDTVFARDKNDVITYWNRGAQELYGWTSEEAVGQTSHDLLRTIFPAPLEEINAELIRTGRWQGELVHTRRDGTQVVAASRWALERDESGRPAAILETNNDITERKRAEEAVRWSEKELRDVIETIPISAWTALPDGSVDFVNRYWREFTGLSTEGTVGVGWMAAVHPGDLERYVEKRRASMASGEPFEGEVRLRRAADGEYRWFLPRAVPLHDEQGKIIKWYGTLTDIEDRKRAEALLAGEKRILEMVAGGASLTEILDSLCRLVEGQAQDVLASILLVEGDRLRHGGAPSLPKAYTDAIDGALIGPSEGSCGAAAYSGKQVIVSDIASDPLWADYREAALPHGLCACWSTPVFSSEGKVIATFAMYYREPRSPSACDQGIIEQITHLAGVAIQRKLGEDELRASEEQWKAVFENNPTMYFMVDAAGITLSVNAFGAAQLGYTPDELVGSPVLNLFYEPEREAVQRNVAHCFDQLNQSMSWEARKVRKDGQVLRVRETARAVLLKNRPVILVACEDITERKHAEEQLEKTEQRLCTVIANAPIILFALDRSGVFTLSEGKGLDALGLQPGEVVGRSASDVYRATPQVLSNIRRVLSGESLTGVVEVDGLIFETHYTPVLDEGGQVGGVNGVAINITERERAEEALRRSEHYLAEAQRLSHTGSWTSNHATGRPVYWSEEMFRISGLDPQGSIPEREEFFRLVHPEDRDRFSELVEKASREKADITADYRIVLSDGTLKHLNVIGHPVLDKNGEVLEYVGTVMDMTERKRAEEALQKAQAELAHVTRAMTMGELASSIAHEVNQPLAAIVTHGNAALRWLAGTPPNLDEVRESVGRIVRDGHRASEVVGRVRALFRKAAAAKERFDINGLIRDVLALVPGELRRNRVRLRTELVTGLPPVMGDRVQLQQVLLNLIINGIEAMSTVSDRQRELIIRSQRHEPDGVLVAVEDSGVGIEAQQQAQIFDAFFTTKPEGLGMGLSISRTTVEAHGGRLWATPNDGQGATFKFTLQACGLQE